MDQSRNIAIGETITVGQLAAAINLPPSKLIGELFKNGIVTNINQRIHIDKYSFSFVSCFDLKLLALIGRTKTKWYLHQENGF